MTVLPYQLNTDEKAANQVRYVITVVPRAIATLYRYAERG